MVKLSSTEPSFFVVVDVIVFNPEELFFIKHSPTSFRIYWWFSNSFISFIFISFAFTWHFYIRKSFPFSTYLFIYEFISVWNWKVLFYLVGYIIYFVIIYFDVHIVPEVPVGAPSTWFLYPFGMFLSLVNTPLLLCDRLF